MKLADLYVPSSPKYLALADAVERGVAGGLLAPGEALPTQLLDYHEKYERWNLQIIPQELE